MKKITFVSLMSLLFLSLCSLFEYILRNITFSTPWVPLIIGGVTLLLSGIVSLKIKRNVVGNIICFITNSVALGFCIRSWYIYRNYNNPLWMMILISAACVIYLLIFYLLLYIPAIEKIFNVYIWAFLGATLVIYLFIMFNSTTTYVSTFGYFVIIEIAFIFAMCKEQHTLKYLFRDIVLSTYSVLVVGVIIALIMLGADSLDGLDMSLDSPSGSFTSPRKRKVIS